ncbi:MAG TPA: ABC transporter substrate-binding protein [Burkholderiaceae bacterium]|nr:ABC transporter substrate-binding protein [Burkholderiaceae bacterium]
MTRTISNLRRCAAALCAAAAGLAAAQTPNEQFFPLLVFRTGPYAPNGVPWANGFVDYLNLVNARDGGINGVKISHEECETGYATDKGVECDERLKGKGPTGAASFSPLSTGITLAISEKALIDKIPIITMGYGRSESTNGSVFAWNFPLMGTYWDAADVLIQHLAKKEGGAPDALRGKRIALLYHDSPYGREPIPVLQELAKRRGFEFTALPVAHPGIDQRSAWLLIRQQRPDYLFLWGWGVMNPTALREAVAIDYPRERMFGVWWAGAEQDVVALDKAATGYSSLTLQHSAEHTGVHDDLLKHVYDAGHGAGRREDVGQVLYNRGMLNAMLAVEAVRTAQARFGPKPLTGEQVRWGAEHLDIDAARIRALGMEGMLRPLKTSCQDHEGVHQYRLHTWDGARWRYSSDWYESDARLLRPMMDEAAKKYAADRHIVPRDCSGDRG